VFILFIYLYYIYFYFKCAYKMLGELVLIYTYITNGSHLFNKIVISRKYNSWQTIKENKYA